jgi:hypothetical protein
MIIAGSCGLISIALVLAVLCQAKENTIRQRLREWYQGKHDKRGTSRQEVLVEPCFAPLLRWILSWWTPDEQRLVLAMDTTALRDTVTVLSIHVVYRGCAIPIAWVVVEATRKGAWEPHWHRLFTRLRDVVPAQWTVIVLADRGLYARWLFKTICARGWHPYLRIKHQHQVRPHGWHDWHPITTLIHRGGPVWCQRVTCFSTPEAQLACTLLLSWAADAEEPWVIVTDLAPEVAAVAWYGMRMWIEASYKDIKRGGWHWEQTKMEEPERVARLWLVMAVATLRVVSVGDTADDALAASSLPDDLGAALAGAKGRRRPRSLSCFRRGRLRILCALIMQEPIPTGRFDPEPWPSGDPARSRPPADPAMMVGPGSVLVLLLIVFMQQRFRAESGAENA